MVQHYFEPYFDSAELPPRRPSGASPHAFLDLRADPPRHASTPAPATMASPLWAPAAEQRPFHPTPAGAHPGVQQLYHQVKPVDIVMPDPLTTHSNIDDWFRRFSLKLQANNWAGQPALQQVIQALNNMEPSLRELLEFDGALSTVSL